MFMVIDRSLQMELVAGDRGGLHDRDSEDSTAICHCYLRFVLMVLLNVVRSHAIAEFDLRKVLMRMKTNGEIELSCMWKNLWMDKQYTLLIFDEC